MNYIALYLQNKTKAFSKRGKFEEEFKSMLPGCDSNSNCQKITILDCVWDSKKLCFYVLDVLMWGGHDLTDYDVSSVIFTSLNFI